MLQPSERASASEARSGNGDRMRTILLLFVYANCRNRSSCLLGGFKGIADAERDCQVRAAAPEGALLLPEEFRLRRGWDRINSGCTEQGSGLICAIHEETGADLVSVSAAMWSISNDVQKIRLKGLDADWTRSGCA